MSKAIHKCPICRAEYIDDMLPMSPSHQPATEDYRDLQYAEVLGQIDKEPKPNGKS